MTKCARRGTPLALVCLLLAACGSSGSGNAAISVPRVGAARQYTLGRFAPAGTLRVGQPVDLSFSIKLPSGRTLTSYKTGPGPHTGVHLIVVRKDLAYIIHEHPPVTSSGVFRQRVTLPAPGPYRVLIDVYPNIPGGQPNFQLLRTLVVAGRYHPRPLPAFRSVQTVDGYHFTMLGHPEVHAIQATFLHVRVTDPEGHRVHFVAWFGALAHAIFFRAGSLDYFHTHICAPAAPNCGSLPGVPSSRISGRATAPGELTVGVLLPTPGKWRLFLQMKPHGRVITAPFTLAVSG
jgi:hypothetical protein